MTNTTEAQPETTYAVNLCGNCIVWHFNNDDSGLESDDPRPMAKLAADGAHLIVSMDEDESHFSWSECDGCGAIAGDRYACTVTEITR